MKTQIAKSRSADEKPNRRGRQVVAKTAKGFSFGFFAHSLRSFAEGIPSGAVNFFGMPFRLSLQGIHEEYAQDLNESGYSTLGDNEEITKKAIHST